MENAPADFNYQVDTCQLSDVATYFHVRFMTKHCTCFNVCL